MWQNKTYKVQDIEFKLHGHRLRPYRVKKSAQLSPCGGLTAFAPKPVGAPKPVEAPKPVGTPKESQVYCIDHGTRIWSWSWASASSRTSHQRHSRSVGLYSLAIASPAP